MTQVSKKRLPIIEVTALVVIALCASIVLLPNGDRYVIKLVTGNEPNHDNYAPRLIDQANVPFVTDQLPPLTELPEESSFHARLAIDPNDDVDVELNETDSDSGEFLPADDAPIEFDDSHHLEIDAEEFDTELQLNSPGEDPSSYEEIQSSQELFEVRSDPELSVSDQVGEESFGQGFQELEQLRDEFREETARDLEPKNTDINDVPIRQLPAWNEGLREVQGSLVPSIPTAEASRKKKEVLQQLPVRWGSVVRSHQAFEGSQLEPAKKQFVEPKILTTPLPQIPETTEPFVKPKQVKPPSKPVQPPFVQGFIPEHIPGEKAVMGSASLQQDNDFVPPK